MRDNRQVATDISVSADLAARYPGYRAVVVVARNLRNGPSRHATVEYLQRAGACARDAVAEGKPAAHPHLATWRQIYQSFGVKPSRHYCSAEALVRRAQRGELPSINELVDIYNAVSLRYLLPVGGENIGALQGPLVLRFAAGHEPSDIPERPGADPEPPSAGEPVWVDELGVTCRRWNWRQSSRTALSTRTTDAFFVLDAAAECAYAALAGAATELASRLAEQPSASVGMHSLTPEQGG